ncbi:MAG TPA: ATP-binding protein [Geobacteraceae bacterium]|nr:ATP-binding protein [Geobacteraceae bacterium]
MKIKTRLRLNTFISLGTVILILLSVVWSWLEIVDTGRDLDAVYKMRRIAFERILLRDEYLLFQEERSGKQWKAKSEALRNLFEQAGPRFDSDEDRTLLENARKDFDASYSGFSKIIEKRMQKDSTHNMVVFSDAEQRQISQVFLKAHSLTDNINRLHESIQQKSTTARDRGAFIVILVICGGIVAIIINSAVIRRTLVKRITALSKGVEIIGSGNLDYRIAAEGNDELSVLAEASNEMAARLKISYTSVEKLQVEIDERKRTETELKESEEKYRTLFDSIDQGFCTIEMIFDEQEKPVDYRFLIVNPAFERQTGIQNAAGLRMREIAPLHEEHWFRIYGQIALTGESLRFENVAEQLQRYYEVFAWRIGAPEERKVAILFKDITARKQADEKIMRVLADLQRSNKELEQFAYVASHDLQEPLRMVSSYTQLLAERYQDKLDDKANLFIHYAVDGAVRMQQLINDLLAFSRIGTKGKSMEPVDAGAVLREAIQNLKMNIEETKTTITNDKLPEVRADASQLVQLFQNLIGNAIKFRGEVSPHIHMDAKDEGIEWLFSVRDNGIGIDPQFADKVFVIFQRLHTREEYPGSGIGLAICKKIVERHGGRIWFESEPDKGATFYFTIRK